jgi:hypothetical protein
MSPQADQLLQVFKDRGLLAESFIGFTDFGDALVWDSGAIADEGQRSALKMLCEQDYLIEYNAGLKLSKRAKRFAREIRGTGGGMLFVLWEESGIRLRRQSGRITRG